MKHIKFIFTFIVLAFFFEAAITQDVGDTFRFLQGTVYGGLPIEVSLNFESENITGQTKYGSDGHLEFAIEGELNDVGYILYEVDKNNVLSGIIEIDKDFQQCVWNSIDYRINLPISFKDKNVETTTIDYVSYQSYVVVSYPLMEGTFEKKMSHEISKIVKEVIAEHNSDSETSSSIPSMRFVKRSIGINKVALNSEKLLSGFVSFYDNQKAEVVTITYTYDKDKEEMLDLSKIFKKNFNYSFFLKQYINQKKESMESLISPLESSWLKSSKFHHYVLTDSGLKFFSDHNTIFGRKSFTIPYHEVSSSIGQKSIANYIKKRK